MTATEAPIGDLRGRVAIVTGAARGIGKATAEAFARAGADLALIDVDESVLEKTAAALSSPDRRVELFAADLANVPEIRGVFARIEETFARFDALANVAAIYPVSPVLDVTEEHWDAIHALDLRGVFFCCQEALRRMFEQQSGTIVNVSSGSAYRAVQRDAAAYSAAKGGVVAMTRSMALEGAAHGVRVNSVAPGYTESDGIKAAVSEEDRAAHGAALVPGRLIQPEEVAAAIVFLCTDAASGMNGAALHVSGGDFMP